MANNVHTLDLNYLGFPGAIAAYLIPHAHGCVLVECGPGSTIPALTAGLKQHGFTPADVTDVFLTHIHLDHAGAAGWLARQGARIHVHPVGAPHMVDPEKLLTSASRIYGDMMETLWGEFLPVPESQLSIAQDNDMIETNGLCLRALDTPGHAYHHYVYLFDDIAFTGDIGGVRLGGSSHLRLPMPPPEFNLEKWRESLVRLYQEYEAKRFKRIAPTHFGIYSDPDWHLAAIAAALDDVEHWMEAVMPKGLPVEKLREEFNEWNRVEAEEKGVTSGLVSAHEVANPAFMSADGIQRYWRKHRAAQ